MAGRSYCRLIEGELFVKPFNWRFKPRGQLTKSHAPAAAMAIVSLAHVSIWSIV